MKDITDVKINFMHPTDGRLLTVTVDSSMTAQEAIAELIANDFIQPNPQGYNIAIKGGKQLQANESFLEGGVTDNDTIRVIPSTDAGGIKYETKRESSMDDKSNQAKRSGIPGLEVSSSDKFTILDIQKSPEALIMIVNMYDDLKIKFEEKSQNYELERIKSNNRFVSTLLLLVSQFILAIGTNLLTDNRSIAIPVIIAGFIQVALALYLAFKKNIS